MRDLYARTKIVATLGPASMSNDVIRRLVDEGADVFRINMAHGNRETHDEVIRRVREIEAATRPLAILVDLAGPKLRLTDLPQDPFDCQQDAILTLVRGAAVRPGELSSNHAGLVDMMDVGDDIYLADGNVRLVVTQKLTDKVLCRVVEPGRVKSRQGLNLPGLHREFPSLTEFDRECIPWAARQDVDYLSLSFVQAPEDVVELKSIVQSLKFDVPVIAKIEKRAALNRLEEVISAADGVMVARGDLGVEIDVADVPVAQKRIVELCNRCQKPVIVATEMLDSMHHSPRPTRAEASDVANAILDGADACMLSGETAIGDYPVEAVKMMNRIMVSAEELLRNRPSRNWTPDLTGAHPVTSAVVFGAAQIASALSAKLVVVSTRTGTTALAKSQRRDFIPTVAVSAEPRTLRRMALMSGIRPLPGIPASDLTELREFIFRWGQQQHLLGSGDAVVFVAGRDTLDSAHNSVSVQVVP